MSDTTVSRRLDHLHCVYVLHQRFHQMVPRSLSYVCNNCVPFNGDSRSNHLILLERWGETDHLPTIRKLQSISRILRTSARKSWGMSEIRDAMSYTRRKVRKHYGVTRIRWSYSRPTPSDPEGRRVSCSF